MLSSSLTSAVVHARNQSNRDPLPVLTTLKPFQLLLSEAYGDLLSVEYLLPPEQSPHHLTLKPSAFATLASARFLLWDGVELESFMPAVLERMHYVATNDPTATLDNDAGLHFSALRELPPEVLRRGPGDAGTNRFDPHFWLGLDAIAALFEALEPALVRYASTRHALDKDESNEFASLLSVRSQSLLNSLKKQKESAIGRYSMPPSARGSTYSFHPAFSYLLADLSLPSEGYLAAHPESGVPPSAMAELMNSAAEGAVCILVEPQFQTQVQRLLGRLDGSTPARQVVADPLGIGDESFSALYGAVIEAALECATE